MSLQIKFTRCRDASLDVAGAPPFNPSDKQVQEEILPLMKEKDCTFLSFTAIVAADIPELKEDCLVLFTDRKFPRKNLLLSCACAACVNCGSTSLRKDKLAVAPLHAL